MSGPLKGETAQAGGGLGRGFPGRGGGAVGSGSRRARCVCRGDGQVGPWGLRKTLDFGLSARGSFRQGSDMN